MWRSLGFWLWSSFCAEESARRGLLKPRVSDPRIEESFCRPYGTWFLFRELTPDLRPGLLYAAPPGLRTERSVSSAASPAERGARSNRVLTSTGGPPFALT